MNCPHCNRPLLPARQKLRADGEQTYCGYIPCACNRPIMTNCGVVYPGDEHHIQLVESGRYDVNDLLNPINNAI